MASVKRRRVNEPPAQLPISQDRGYIPRIPIPPRQGYPQVPQHYQTQPQQSQQQIWQQQQPQQQPQQQVQQQLSEYYGQIIQSISLANGWTRLYMSLRPKRFNFPGQQILSTKIFGAHITLCEIWLNNTLVEPANYDDRDNTIKVQYSPIIYNRNLMEDIKDYLTNNHIKIIPKQEISKNGKLFTSIL